MTTTTRKPTNAQHHTNADGTVTVVYGTFHGDDRVELGFVTYKDSREASIESTLRLFPGTDRDWLERMHKD